MSDPDPEDYGNPHAVECALSCSECGAEYRGLAVPNDPSYDSPGWNEPEPGHELCPTCRTRESVKREITARVLAFIEGGAA